MNQFNPLLTFSEGQFSANKYAGIESFDKLRIGDGAMSSQFNSSAVYMMGNFSKNYPVLQELQGLGKKRAIRSVDGTLYSYIFGRPKKISVIAKNIYGDKEQVGRGGAMFYMFFKDRWFMKNQELIVDGLNGQRVHCQSDGVPDGSFYKYECRIMGTSNEYLNPKYLKAGTRWAGGVVSVSLEHSRGTEQRSYSGFKIQNQIALVRQSFKVAGNIENKVMDITIDLGNNKKFQSYVSWEKYITEQDFNTKKEVKLLTSKWNKDKGGYIQNVDANSGKPVPSFNGLWEMVPNFNTLNYTRLTENRFSNMITDILSITSNLDLIGSKNSYVVDIMGGYGLAEEFDKAFKRLPMVTNLTTGENFIRKDGDGLNYGGYFKSYTHMSGVTFRIKHHPIFESGSEIAESSPYHPINTSLRMSSYSGLILNFGRVSTDTQYSSTGMGNNISMLYEEGREFIDSTVRGMAQIEGKQGGDISTDIDASSREMMCSIGLEVLNPQSLGKIQCVLS